MSLRYSDKLQSRKLQFYISIQKYLATNIFQIIFPSDTDAIKAFKS